MTIGDRIRIVREYFKLNQRSFASSIKIGQSTLAMFENNQREVRDIHIDLICSKYGINEEWLRTGNGDMVLLKEDNLTALLAKIDIEEDDFIKDLIEVYMELDDTSKNALRKIADSMIEKRNKRRQI